MSPRLPIGTQDMDYFRSPLPTERGMSKWQAVPTINIYDKVIA